MENKEPILVVKDLKQHFKINRNFTVKAVDGISFDIMPGETYGLVGESGSGKSTTGRSIIRLYKPTSGSIVFNGKEIGGKLDKETSKELHTKMQMIFQDPMACLNPRKKVIDIIGQGLDIHKSYSSIEERNEKIYEMLELVGLSREHASRYPHQFSGGQRQRVALGRAIVREPKVFLMDEPLSNLDAKLRVQMRVEILKIYQQLGTTFIYVTHDQIEAMSMGDNIILMDKGVIMQRSTPKEMYHNPQNVYTAQFIGTPPMNIVDNMVPDIKIGFRPEKTSFLDPGEALLDISGRIITKEQLGAEMNYSVETAYGKVIVKTEEDIESDRCRLYVREQHLFAFAKDGKRMEVTPEIRNAVRNLEKGA